MKVSRLAQYRLVEGDEHFSIVPSNKNVAGAHQLIISDLYNCLAYTERYLDERANGKSEREAHGIALRNVKTTLVRGRS